MRTTDKLCKMTTNALPTPSAEAIHITTYSFLAFTTQYHKKEVTPSLWMHVR